MRKIKYRHEVKQEITFGDMLVLRQRLSAVMTNDIHAANGQYKIRSLYFDNARDKALREKINGVNVREKFRLRYYNDDTSVIKLEKKSKVNGLCHKEVTEISEKEVQDILDGKYDWMISADRPLVRELGLKIKTMGLHPKTIIDYTREPFCFKAGNVRVTLDSNIRTGIGGTDFLNPDCVMVPAGDAPIILEVKWDEYLPDIIKAAVQLKNGRAGAFSKYAAGRVYG